MPNRLIKESIRTSRSVNNLSDFDFRVWTYLITYVDDYGRGSADAELLKGLCFPRRKGITEAQIEKAVANLAMSGMVTLYMVDGEPYLAFPNWDKHQQIRAKTSKFPAPEDGILVHDIKCNQMISDDIRCPRNPIQSNPNPNTNPIQNAQARGVAADGFEKFWSAYPKKVGKDAARKAWPKTKDVSIDIILAAVENQKRSAQWQKDNGQYIPNPATWLNQGRWQDVVTPVSGYVDGTHRELDADEAAAIRRMMEDM